MSSVKRSFVALGQLERLNARLHNSMRVYDFPKWNIVRLSPHFPRQRSAEGGEEAKESNRPKPNDTVA